MPRSGERGIAIVMAMFMTLIVSALAASMAFVARTEALSSQSYTTMAQARYAAESGLAAAANYLLSSQYPQPTLPDANFDITVSPVRRSGAEVVLSSAPNTSNYPVAAVVTAFENAASGTLAVSNGNVAYAARARLLAMRQLNDAGSGENRTLQTWEITGIGRLGGSGSAEVRVTAVIERPTVSMYRYAAFATHNGCSALSFEGGATSKSYTVSGTSPVIADNGGHVGTNGNLNLSGSTTQIFGTLSTPRAGVGSCTANNVTAATVQGNGAQVHGGLVELPQVVEYPVPPTPAPAPPTTTINFTRTSGCTALTACAGCSNAALCSPSTNGATITPSGNDPYLLGNVVIDGQGELVLRAGTYHVNSLSVAGNSQIKVVAGDGPVIIKVTGQGQTTPINIAGNSISNPTFNSANLQLVYAGTNNVYVGGGTATAALINAPRAYVEVTGNSSFYGAVVGGRVRVPGSATLYFDTNLSRHAQSAGNPIMSSFTWQSF